jgi:3-hydroxybutyrate dehydrogenase
LLRGKVALITGSTSGIGKGIAEAFARAGCCIVLNGFGDADEIERCRVELSERRGVTVSYSRADMAAPDQIRDMISDAIRDFGCVDILVNNAGIQHTARIEEFPEDQWDKIVAVNLSAAFHTIKAVLPSMRYRGWGRIINISSAHGLVASAEKAAYVASKHGLIGLTKVVAIETANDGITANAICPGWVSTPLVGKQVEHRAAAANISIDEAQRLLLADKQPMHSFTTPEQIGELALFLASDAAGTVTGTTISMDGGWTAI